MTFNRFLTTLMQSFFGAITITLWVLIIRDLIHERRIARYERAQIKWVFPPHSETKRLAAAHRLFDSELDTVHSELDTVHSEVDR